MLELGWQKFLGREYRLKQPHGLDRPLLVDASGGAAHDAHFTRCLPLSEDRILIEDVQLSELSGLDADRSEEHTSELQLLMRISYAVFCLTKKHIQQKTISTI